jgi:hypothetical protein
MKKILIPILTIFISIQCFSQDTLVRKNTIAFVPTSLLNRTIWLSYSRAITPALEITLNVSLRKAKSETPEVSHNQILDTYIVDDPFWYYNRYRARSGVSKHLGDFMFMDIGLQFEYAYFENQTLKVDDNAGDAYDLYWQLDRNFYSVGLTMLGGFCHDYNRFRLKIFGGFDFGYRYYEEIIYEIREWNSVIYTNPDNTATYYEKRHYAVKFGVELGLKL